MAKNSFADLWAATADPDAKPLPTISESVYASLFAEIAAPAKPVGRPRTVREDRPSTSAERMARVRSARHAQRVEDVAVLDMETDPFDNTRPDELIRPFTCEIYSPQFDPIVIWEEDYEKFISLVLGAILSLPRAFTIYAHNGGKFDFMLFVHRLRGSVSFKGRGIMAAHIGPHQIRDSFHIVPEKLASYSKQQFDYSHNLKRNRAKFKDAIIRYQHNDCVKLYELVRKFIDKNGLKISIGAAALAKIRENYRVETLSQFQDDAIRPFYYGGRVDCIAGRVFARQRFNLYDINSAYPWAMAHKLHPTGSEYFSRSGKPGRNTVFVELHCDNHGALFGRRSDGSTETSFGTGRFLTTIHEYNTALELGLIRNVEIIRCVDNVNQTKFDKFILPLYAERQELKKLLDQMERAPGFNEDDPAYLAIKGDATIVKLLMNNGYGKFAVNPRRFKDHFITDPYERPEDDDGSEWGEFAEFQGADYWIWSRPAPHMKFLNVGTSASITGAVRARLMRAIHHAKNPIYCDTDSLICEELRGEEIDASKLGAWKFEKELSEVIICGKKQYSYRDAAGKEKAKCKGIDEVSFADMQRIFEGETLSKVMKGPTLTRRGDQRYITRRIAATALLKIA